MTVQLDLVLNAANASILPILQSVPVEPFPTSSNPIDNILNFTRNTNPEATGSNPVGDAILYRGVEAGERYATEKGSLEKLPSETL